MQIQQHGLEHSLRLDDGYIFDGGTVRVALNVDTIPVIAFVLVLGIGLIACESLWILAVGVGVGVGGILRDGG